MKKLTALIPVHNDDYTLWFCLRSIAPYFAEIIVFNDASIDNTREVVEKVAKTYPHIQYLEHSGKPLGWADARRELIARAKGKHLFFIDADEILLESQAHWLQKIPSLATVVYWRFTDIWGDFNHTTQRVFHSDFCHVYVNRNRVDELDWTMKVYGVASTPVIGSDDTRVLDEILFWHARGVKPDWRILQRPEMNAWHEKRREGTPHDFLHKLDQRVIHDRALKVLLTSGEHQIQPWRGETEKPRIVADADTRFEMVYKNGQIVDRRDHGWWGARCFHFADDDNNTAWDNFFPHRCDDVGLRQSGDSFIFNVNGQCVSCNHPLAYIWSQCGEGQTIGDIKRVIASEFGVEAAADVMPALRNLAKVHCIAVDRW